MNRIWPHLRSKLVAQQFMLWGLLLIFSVSASALIYSQHRSRQLTSELQILTDVQTDLDIEWGRLLLEQGAWSNHGYLETEARQRLNMHALDAAQIKRVEF
jgi:cell division protein FtsL